MKQNNSPPSTASFVLEKLKHFRKSQMSSVLRSLISSESKNSKTTSKPFMKLFSSSNCNSPLVRDMSLFEQTQDQTLKQLDLSNLHEFEYKMTPHSQINSFSRDIKLIPFINVKRYLKSDKRYSIILYFEKRRDFKYLLQQIVLIQKALMYSWAYYYQDEEIQCYDAMGLAYFYQGNVERADFYHQKWTNGYLEESSSYYRITALEFIQMFERTLPTKATNFFSSIQGSISVPFINIVTGKNYDEKRFVKYNNCNPIEIIYSMTKAKEFSEFNLIHHEQTLALNSKIKRQPKLPKRILEITEKYKSKDLYSFNHKILENPQYKQSLQQQVDFRITQSFSVQQVNQNVKKFISSQREPFMKAQQIYIRGNNKQKEFVPTFVGRYQKMLIQILK